MGDTSKQEGLSVKCTWLCGNGSISRNCSHTFLFDISLDYVKNKVLRAYVIVDDQNHCTLVNEELIQLFGKPYPTQHYTMTFAQHGTRLPVDGHIISNLRVKGVRADKVVNCGALSCPNLAGTRLEAATPQIAAMGHAHATPYADKFPEFDKNARVMMLIGRDQASAMKVQTLTNKTPYVMLNSFWARSCWEKLC